MSSPDLWRIWYSDGSIYSSEDGPPESAPGHGVQVIVQPDQTPEPGNVGYVRLAGYDWYYWNTEDREWAGAMGDPAILDLILHREPIVGVCQGRRISRKRYQAIVDEAAKWAELHNLPAKSGHRLDELNKWVV